MDIIITGPQGAGKSTTADTIAEKCNGILYVFDYGQPLKYVLDSLREKQPQAVVFDAIPSQKELSEALNVALEYRRFAKTPITAIYCTQMETLNIVR